MDLSGNVDRVGVICRRFRIDSLAPRLAACGELLGGGVVDVAVLGQFKTGKEWRILPVSDRPGFEGMRKEVAEYLRERIAGPRSGSLPPSNPRWKREQIRPGVVSIHDVGMLRLSGKVDKWIGGVSLR